MTTPKWLDLKVSIGNIGSILTVIIGLTAGYYSIISDVSANRDELVRQDRRLATVEAKIEAVAGELAADRLGQTTILTELRADVRYLRQSVDELKARGAQ